MRRTLETYSNFVFETQIKIWEKTDAQDVSKVLRDIADHYEFDGFCLGGELINFLGVAGLS